MNWLNGWPRYSNLFLILNLLYIQLILSFLILFRNCEICSDELLVSFDIVSLYTNVPLQDTLKICFDALYRGHRDPTLIPKPVFGILAFRSRLLLIIYMPKSVLMGSSLGPVLANIFVGFYESFLFKKCHKPHVYLHSVDDMFPIFDSINDAMVFHIQLNSLHPSLQITMEMENDCTLPFLDVFEHKDGLFITSVYFESGTDGL